MDFEHELRNRPSSRDSNGRDGRDSHKTSTVMDFEHEQRKRPSSRDSHNHSVSPNPKHVRSNSSGSSSVKSTTSRSPSFPARQHQQHNSNTTTKDQSVVKVEILTTPERCGSTVSLGSSSQGQAYCSEIMRSMNELRESNTLCDVMICVDGKTFPAHRTILAASSPYFKALFSSGLSESNSESKPVVLTDIDADCMEKLLSYIYTGEIELNDDNIKAVISAANYLLISSLKDRCTLYLKKMLTPVNCLNIESTAERYNCEWLRSTATSYIRENYVAISSTDEFLGITHTRLIDFVSSDDTKIDREEQIFESIMNWVKHDEDERRQHFKELVSYVRFPLISPYYLMDHVESEELVRQTPECISLLLEAKNYHMLPDRRWQLKSKRTTPRKSMGIVNGIIAVGGIQGPSSSVVASTASYLLCNNQWFVLAKMQTPRCRHGLAVTGEFVYAAGGQYREGAAQSSLAHVERYDPKTNTWSSVSQLLTRRSLLNIAALEGYLYAVGGCDENNMRLNSVEKYNPSTDTWTFIPSMTACRSSPCVVADKFLFVMGGVSYVGMALNSAAKYDPHTSRWSKIASMNCSRASACCAAVNGKIYVIGGWDGTTHLNSGEVYDSDTDKWTFIAPASTARWDAGVAVDGDKIYIVGGCDRNAVCTLQTECYNTETDSWSQVASLPVATHGLKCCTIQLPSKFV